MATKDDGGQIPATIELRDYFAAAALTGLLAWSPPNVNADDGEDISGNVAPHTAASWAYEYADEMLAARRAVNERDTPAGPGDSVCGRADPQSTVPTE